MEGPKERAFTMWVKFINTILKTETFKNIY